MAHAPDLVLMDVQLPGIDGVEALGRLRDDDRTAAIPVLALTAQAMQGDREQFLAAGFDGYGLEAGECHRVPRHRREEAVAHAFRSFGMTPEEVEQMRGSHTWSARIAAAHTVAREVRAEEAYRLDSERFGDLAAPVLFLLGEESPDWAREGTERIRAVLLDARVAILRGQGHVAIMTAPELVADEVARFLSE